jgi:hypothetical protein
MDLEQPLHPSDRGGHASCMHTSRAKCTCGLLADGQGCGGVLDSSGVWMHRRGIAEGGHMAQGGHMQKGAICRRGPYAEGGHMAQGGHMQKGTICRRGPYSRRGVEVTWIPDINEVYLHLSGAGKVVIHNEPGEIPLQPGSDPHP